MTANPGGGDYRPETRPTDAVAWVRVNLGAYRADRTLAVHRDGFWWTDVDCDDTGISGHRHDDPGEVTVLEVLRPASGPVSVAQDATDATETPARTPGGSDTTEARTEAQGGRTSLYPLATLTPQTAAAMAEDIGASPDSLFVDWINRGKEIARLTAEPESATDPGMTNLESELVALRAQVARVEAALDVIDEVAYYQIGVEQMLTTMQTGRCRAMVPPHWQDEANDRARAFRTHFRAALDGA